VFAWGGKTFQSFFNAGIQGINNVARATRRHPVKATVLHGVMMGLGYALVQAALAAGDDDDNSYFDLPDYVRRSNICLRGGEGKWITIPLTPEYRVMYGMGELLASVMSKKEVYSEWEMAQKVAELCTQVLPVNFLDAGSGKDEGFTGRVGHLLMPTILRPAYEVRVNKSWTGLPVYRDYDPNGAAWERDKAAMPEWTKAYSSTPEFVVAAAKGLSDLTGGNDYKPGWIDFNPEVANHLLKAYCGGLYNMVCKLPGTVDTAKKAVSGRAEEADLSKTLFLSRLVKSVDERTHRRAVDNKYRHYEEELAETARLDKAYMKAAMGTGRKGDVFEYAKLVDEMNNSEAMARYLYVEEERQMIKKLDGAIKKARKAGNEELQEALTEQSNVLKARVVEKLENFGSGMKDGTTRQTVDSLVSEKKRRTEEALTTP